MLGVDHDKILLLSTPFPTIPMLGKNCCYNVIVFYVGNKRCCIVLYCIVLYCKRSSNDTERFGKATELLLLRTTQHIHELDIGVRLGPTLATRSHNYGSSNRFIRLTIILLSPQADDVDAAYSAYCKMFFLIGIAKKKPHAASSKRHQQ